jgi:hypothetical protein
VAVFGVSPAVAAVIAALLIKIVVAPAADEICQCWAKTLDGADSRVSLTSIGGSA